MATILKSVVGRQLGLGSSGRLLVTPKGFTDPVAAELAAYTNVAASTAVSNSTTETLFDKSFSVPAMALRVGSLVRVRFQGIATATNSTDTLTIKLYANSYRNIAGATTTVVKSAAGMLARIVSNNAIAASVITVYDNTAASGPKIATITQPSVLLSSATVINYDCAFATGLTIVTSAADDITVVYR